MHAQHRCTSCGSGGHNSRSCPGGATEGLPVLAEEGPAMAAQPVQSYGNVSSESESEAEHSVQRKERKRGNAWSTAEHGRFLVGLRKLGKGDWRGIAKHYVPSRTSTQVASHAQKYFLRQLNLQSRKRRSSLFDMAPDPDSDAATSVEPSPEPAARPQGSELDGTAAGSRTSSFEQAPQAARDMDGAQTHFPGQEPQVTLMQQLMHAAAAGMGPPIMAPMGRAPAGIPGQQQGYNPFLPFGGSGPAQGMPPQVAQAIMQQQAAAAMFGAGQPGMPGFGTGPPPDMDPATAMRSIQFAQAMAANAAMMGFQNGGGMSFNGGAPFQGAPRQMPFGQAGFSGPPSPGNMSAVGSVANGALDPESLQQGGNPRADSPSSDSVDGLDCLEQCTFDEQMRRQQDGRQLGTGEAKPAANSSMGVYAVPEQQPEGPLGIENAKSGSKEGSEKHSGHGRLYRPQATLARQPASGVPSGKMFARPDNPIKAGGHSSGSLPFSMMEPSQDGLSNSKRSTSDRLSLGRLSGSQGQQSPFKLVEPVREVEQQ